MLLSKSLQNHDVNLCHKREKNVIVFCKGEVGGWRSIVRGGGPEREGGSRLGITSSGSVLRACCIKPLVLKSSVFVLRALSSPVVFLAKAF